MVRRKRHERECFGEDAHSHPLLYSSSCVRILVRVLQNLAHPVRSRSHPGSHPYPCGWVRAYNHTLAHPIHTNADQFSCTIKLDRHGPTDQRTDKAPHRVAYPQLKKLVASCYLRLVFIPPFRHESQ